MDASSPPEAERWFDSVREPAADAFATGTDWLAFGATAVLAFAVYLFTLAPEVTLSFSGIFSTGALYGGVPHPPGYPLWTCYAWTFIKLLPFGNVAWRVGVSSATATALACGIIALLVSREGAALLAHLNGERTLTATVRQWTRLVSGGVAGLVFGFSGSVWQRAVRADVWPLTLLLLTLFLCLMRRWIHSPTQKRFLFAASFVYGAGLTNSQALLTLAPAIPVLILPADKKLARDFFGLFAVFLMLALVFSARKSLLLYPYVRRTDLMFEAMVFLVIAALSTAAALIVITRSALTEWKTVIRASVAVLFGLSLYLYVPLASMTNPPMNWGYARTVGGFMHTLTRGQYEMVQPTSSAGQWLTQMGTYAAAVSRDFGTICLVPALLLPFVWRKLNSPERGWIAALAAVYGCFSFLLVALLNPATDLGGQGLVEVFYSLSYVVLSLWLGYGVTVVIARFGVWLLPFGI